MINQKYCKAILNALFHLDGVSGLSPEEEQAELENLGIAAVRFIPYDEYELNVQRANKVEAAVESIRQEYQALWTKYGNSKKSEDWENLANVEENRKNAVVASSWWEVVTQQVALTGDPSDNESKYVSVWYATQRVAESVPYPTDAYLALYTQMPDEYGEGYIEPVGEPAVYGDDGQIVTPAVQTTYMRINLYDAIITGNECMNDAYADPETGAATIDNSEIMAYPEVYGVQWGTIVGFGVHASSVEGGGDKPVFWGRINPSIASRVNYVPLFRKGNFKITLQ